MIPDIKDRLDILAIDPQGKAVIIELKRGALKDPVDTQALRYASYISKWRFDDFENQAKNFYGKIGDPAFNFNEMIEQFCANSGIDEVPDLNTDQRLIIVGSEVRDKLGSVALWLRDHNIDIKVIEVEVFKEADTILLQPQTIIPLPISRFDKTGKAPVGEIDQPWVTDGKTWHLEKRCSPTTKNIFLRLDDLIRDNFPDLEGPRWDQKFYIAYRLGNMNWIAFITRVTTLEMHIHVKSGVFTSEDIAKRLKIQEFAQDDTLAEKIGTPSSVMLQHKNASTDRIVIRIKEGFDLEQKEFLDFLKDAKKAFPK